MLRYGPGSGLASAGSVVTENVTAQLGITTYLHCRVNNLGGKMVSQSKEACLELQIVQLWLPSGSFPLGTKSYAAH